MQRLGSLSLLMLTLLVLRSPKLSLLAFKLLVFQLRVPVVLRRRPVTQDDNICSKDCCKACWPAVELSGVILWITPITVPYCTAM